jgi:autotransporter translocation and assembly factor TamB
MNKAEMGPEKVPFVMMSSESRSSDARRGPHKTTPAMTFPEGPHIELGPFPVAIGRPVAPVARGWISRNGYNISIAGDADIAKSLRVARMIGLPALQAAVEGTAEVDLQIAGSWAGWTSGTHSGFPGPQIAGSAKLRNLRIAVRGTGGPIEISSAEMQFERDRVRIGKLNAKAAGTLWTGSLAMPRGCGTPGTCPVQFDVSANQIAFSELNDWVNARPKDRPWYRVLESNVQTGPSFLGSLRASGRLTTERLQVQSLAATHVSAKVDLDGGKVEISELNGDFLGGKHRGEWQADFTVKPTVCKGSGSVTGISMARLADTMKDDWIAGTASGNYDVKGTCPAEFWSSAEGTLQFDVKDGTLPHISLGEDSGVLKVTRLAGQARLHAGELEIKDAKLDSGSGKFLLSGTASLKRELDLKLAKPANGTAGAGYTISGTLAEPRVVQSPETQARLKTEPAK